jgi:RimJ/RimL family protein N-acetyltransferase
MTIGLRLAAHGDRNNPLAVVAARKATRTAIIAGAGESLVPLRPADVTDAYVDGMRDPEVTRFMYGVRKTPQTRDTVAGYVRFNQDDAAGLLFGIYAAGTLRGTIRLHAIEPAEGSCHLGICIFDKSCWGNGLAGRCLAAATRFATDEMRLGRIVAGIDVENTVSARLFAGAGFRSDPSWRYQLDGRQTDRWVLDGTRNS